MLQDSRYDNMRNNVIQFKQQWRQMVIDIIFYRFDTELDA